MNTRPYVCTFNGKRRIVEATSQPQAIAHLAKSLVEDMHATNGKEVSAFIRDGGRVEVAGEEPEPPIQFKTGGEGDDDTTDAQDRPQDDDPNWSLGSADASSLTDK